MVPVQDFFFKLASIRLAGEKAEAERSILI